VLDTIGLERWLIQSGSRVQGDAAGRCSSKHATDDDAIEVKMGIELRGPIAPQTPRIKTSSADMIPRLVSRRLPASTPNSFFEMPASMGVSRMQRSPPILKMGLSVSLGGPPTLMRSRPLAA